MPECKSRRLCGAEVQYKIPVSTNTLSIVELELRKRFVADLYGNAPGNSISDSASSDEQGMIFYRLGIDVNMDKSTVCVQRIRSGG